MTRTPETIISAVRELYGETHHPASAANVFTVDDLRGRYEREATRPTPVHGATILGLLRTCAVLIAERDAALSERDPGGVPGKTLRAMWEGLRSKLGDVRAELAEANRELEKLRGRIQKRVDRYTELIGSRRQDGHRIDMESRRADLQSLLDGDGANTPKGASMIEREQLAWDGEVVTWNGEPFTRVLDRYSTSGLGVSVVVTLDDEWVAISGIGPVHQSERADDPVTALSALRAKLTRQAREMMAVCGILSAEDERAAAVAIVRELEESFRTTAHEHCGSGSASQEAFEIAADAAAVTVQAIERGEHVGGGSDGE